MKGYKMYAVVVLLCGATVFAEPFCGPVCLIRCEFGNAMDVNGCPMCTCNDAPTEIRPHAVCKDIDCDLNCGLMGFDYDAQGCRACKCRALPKLDLLKKIEEEMRSRLHRDCKPLECKNTCHLHGYKPDRYGCPTCECRENEIDEIP